MGKQNGKCHKSHKCCKNIEYIGQPEVKLCPNIKTSVIMFSGLNDDEDIPELYLPPGKDGFRKTITLLDHFDGLIHIVYIKGQCGMLSLTGTNPTYELVYTRNLGWQIINNYQVSIYRQLLKVPKNQLILGHY